MVTPADSWRVPCLALIVGETVQSRIRRVSYRNVRGPASSGKVFDARSRTDARQQRAYRSYAPDTERDELKLNQSGVARMSGCYGPLIQSRISEKLVSNDSVPTIVASQPFENPLRAVHPSPSRSVSQ